MNIAQLYYRWRKTLGTYRRIDLVRDFTVNPRTVDRWLSGASKPNGSMVRRIEAEIAKLEDRLSRAGNGRVTMPRGMED